MAIIEIDPKTDPNNANAAFVAFLKPIVTPFPWSVANRSVTFDKFCNSNERNTIENIQSI